VVLQTLHRLLSLTVILELRAASQVRQRLSAMAADANAYK
jgi:hypothetical protein